MDYNIFQCDSTNPLKYVGFDLSLGSAIPDVKWKVYTNHLPSYCYSKAQEQKIRETRDYKQTCNCIEDKSASTELIIYDVVTPDCIYYTSNLSNTLEFTYAITEPHDYVTMKMRLFAEFSDTMSASVTCIRTA
eukprot:902298_1